MMLDRLKTSVRNLYKRVKRFFLRLYLTHKYRRQSKQDRSLKVRPIRKRNYRDKCRQRYYESGCHNLRRAMAARYMKQGMSREDAWQKAKGITRTLAHKRKAWGL